MAEPILKRFLITFNILKVAKVWGSCDDEAIQALGNGLDFMTDNAAEGFIQSVGGPEILDIQEIFEDD